MMTVAFQFDYSLDTKGFFNDASRRELLEYAGQMLTDNLSDTLSAIAPSGSNTWTPSVIHPGTGASYNLGSSTSIAADKIRVYVGGRDLASPTLAETTTGGYTARGNTTWFNTIKGRGEAGALASSPTDTAPWGGSITFDTTGPRWHFGKTTSGLDRNESDFLSVAVHELGHMLGIRSGNAAFTRLISGGKFTGANAKAAYNNQAVPTDPTQGHWKEGVRSDDGIEVSMDPSTTAGERKLFSKLDFAGLKDIGWEVGTLDDTLTRAKHLMTQFADSGGIGTGGGLVTSGGIGSAKDVDLYRIYAGANTTLSVSVTPTGYDSYLRLFDANGVELKHADQGFSGQTDTLDYTFGRNDYYFIGVSSYGNRAYNPKALNSGPGGATGNYRLGLTTEGSAFAYAANANAAASTTTYAQASPDVSRDAGGSWIVDRHAAATNSAAAPVGNFSAHRALPERASVKPSTIARAHDEVFALTDDDDSLGLR